MLEAEAVMRDQINRDEQCSQLAGGLLAMRGAMSLLVVERPRLGDHEPILVNGFFIPRRAPAPKPVAARSVKHHLVPAKSVPDDALKILGLWKPSMFAGFMGAFASQFWFLAFALTAAANVRTLALVEVLFAQAVAYYSFKQPLSVRELGGIALIVIGVALLIAV
jgi:drug/metabolite transporter (DMT)-like permease